MPSLAVLTAFSHAIVNNREKNVKHIALENKTKRRISNTVELRLTVTSLLLSSRYYGHLVLSRGNALDFPMGPSGSYVYRRQIARFYWVCLG